MDVKQSNENLIGKGKAGPGRPKGVPNKTTKAAKEAIHEAFEQLGGVPALVTWAQAEENKKVFYSQIWPKIVPLQVGGEEGNPLAIEIRNHIVRPGD